MPKVFEGQLSAAGLRFAVIVSRFNSFITERLLGGAMDALTRTGANPDLIDVIKVPGSWEVPLVAGEVARQHRYDAIICLSAVIVAKPQTSTTSPAKPPRESRPWP